MQAGRETDTQTHTYRQTVRQTELGEWGNGFWSQVKGGIT